MDSFPPPKKKGLGGLAWLGIGCGGVVVLGVIVVILANVLFGPQIKRVFEASAKIAASGGNNPARAAATMMIAVGGDKFEMAAEDDVNKRYTVRVKQGGSLITLYWDAKTNSVKNVPGDFSAVPADANPPSTPAPP